MESSAWTKVRVSNGAFKEMNSKGNSSRRSFGFRIAANFIAAFAPAALGHRCR
jgi:hypothetical protein